ncbi:hypothetical protein Salat_0943000 [Sesamum alatum]|uniref:Uncharacterized protein n=1 Tax=Sesamum alatum TaxID=300844 RepID=A0AAE2CRR6_9LAMI|nr:hypothetical protein Salat_0943000 [Sesamum alatum]
MVYTYTPTYYSSLHDSITSICKTILPFSFKKRRIPAIAAAEQRLSKQQSDNLKWQQDSFHKILNLMGLCREGIVPEMEVSAFRTHLLETLIASPVDHEPPAVLRDKLIFLQELLYAKCISEEEYHASKRPLLQRLAVQGAEIEARDVIVRAHKETSDDEWSVIDLKDEKSMVNQEMLASKNTSKEGSSLKKMKAAVSVFGFVSPDKNGKSKEKNNDACTADARGLGMNDRNVLSTASSRLHENESDSKPSLLMVESLPSEFVMAEKQSLDNKGKRKPFQTLFQREPEGRGRGCGGGGHHIGLDSEEKGNVKPGKKAWIFDGFKKWKKNDTEDERDRSSLNEKSDGASYGGKLVANPVGEGPDTKQIKRKLHPNGAPTDFFVDKVLGENIKKELSRIRTELFAKDPNVLLSDDEIEAISTRLPVDKADLEKFFSKSWCDQYGDIVLDVVRKEFKNHMKEMGNSRGKAGEKRNNNDENSHPNLFAAQRNSSCTRQGSSPSSNNDDASKGFKYNPFFDM